MSRPCEEHRKVHAARQRERAGDLRSRSPASGAGGTFSTMVAPSGEFESPYALEFAGTASLDGRSSLRVESLTAAGSFYDASAYDGIRFRIQFTTPGNVRFGVGTPTTLPVSAGGLCTSGCMNLHGFRILPSTEWQTVEVRWADLTQAPTGTPAAFTSAAIKLLEWQVEPGTTVGFRIDHVELIRR
jgi:hypothetical protein